MNIIECEIPGPLIIEPRVFGDDRGFFLESWNRDAFAEVNLNLDFVQDNHSRSSRGVLRGLHYQNPRPQGKLVRVVNGRAFDVAVDIRRSSPNFGRWVGVELSGDNKRLFWVPPGFAHGFLALEDATDFLYKCTDFYRPEHEQSVRWDDPAIGIDWPLSDLPIELSTKDLAAKTLWESETYA